jgi:EAL domain-containing protein (putative c-di-GMP-specific phosphodiesterase class I)
VRWQHPTWGLLQPGQFIPLADETGQVERIGRWVLAKACRQARAWQERLAEPPVVAVNLSTRQFRRPDLVEVVAFMLRETGLDPRLLKLEITESAVMADAETAVATLRRLKDLGVGLAIDDFGTGYSSLNYLRHFPVDALKIDRAFVAGLGRDAGDAAIVAAVIGLANTLGLRVVAEGIETIEQVGLLRTMGCEQGQGYRFGRPQPVGPTEALLEKVTFAVGAPVRLAG